MEAKLADLTTLAGTLRAALAAAGCEDLETCAADPDCPIPFPSAVPGAPAGAASAPGALAVGPASAALAVDPASTAFTVDLAPTAFTVDLAPTAAPGMRTVGAASAAARDALTVDGGGRR